MNTAIREKYITTGILAAVTIHLILLYFIGWVNISKRLKPEKVLMPVEMMITPAAKKLIPEMPVAVKRPIRTFHMVKQHSVPVQTGHNKFLSSAIAKAPAHAGFTVPQGGKVKAGTVMSHQGASSTSQSVTDIDLPPMPVFNPMPVIPSNLRAQKYSTSVRVEFIVNAHGSFMVKLLSTTGYDELDRTVLATLKRWKFSPATQDGTPVPGTLQLRIQFSVD